MKKLNYLLLSLFVFTGCVTHQAKGVRERITKVDYSKAISKEDALTIAQNYVLIHKIPVYNLATSAQMGKFIMASGQVIDVWKVKFSQKNIKHLLLPFAYEVDINIRNGDVVHSEKWE